MYLLPWGVRLIIIGLALLPVVAVAYRDRDRILGRCYWCHGFLGLLHDEDEFFCSDWCFDECAVVCPPVGLPEPVA